MSENNTRAPSVGTVAESLRYLLLHSIGRMVVVDFWFGGDTVVHRCGVLTAVGTDYLLLTDEANQLEIAGGLDSLRLVTVCRGAAESAGSASAADVTGSADVSGDTGERSAQSGSSASGDAAGESGSGSVPQAPLQTPVSPVIARAHSQAAFNYAKRKTRRLE